MKHSTNLLTQRVARSLCGRWASCHNYEIHKCFKHRRSDLLGHARPKQHH